MNVGLVRKLILKDISAGLVHVESGDETLGDFGDSFGVYVERSSYETFFSGAAI